MQTEANKKIEKVNDELKRTKDIYTNRKKELEQ